MKNFINYLLICFALSVTTGCSQSDNGAEIDSIMGSWQLTARFDGGSPIKTKTIENGKIIEFSDEMTFSDSSAESCSATYRIEDTVITIESDCDDIASIYAFSFKDGNLLLTKLPNFCDEGCYQIYSKK